MIRIQFYSLLRLLLRKEQLELPACPEETIRQLLQRVQEKIATPFLDKLLDERGELHAGTIILVNRRNILHLKGLATPVKDGDLVAFFPPGAGG
jgi:molybdopterin synthase sulfur carrier subunit